MMEEPLGQRKEKATGFKFLGNNTNVTFNNSVINVPAGKNELHSTVEVGPGAKPKRPTTCSSNQQQESSNSAVEAGSSSTAIDRPRPIWNDVWMHVDSAQIFSYFCKDEESVKDLRQYLELEHKRIMHLPKEVIATVGNKLETEFKCDTPADMQLTTLDSDKFKILSPELQRKWIEICYESVPHPDKLQHPDAYKLTYQAKLFNNESEPIDGGFMAHLQFQWPLIPKQQERSVQGASSGRHIAVSNLHVERDVYIGGQGTHTDNRAAPSRNVDSSSAADYLSQTHTVLNKSCAQKSWKIKMTSPDGKIIKLDKCQVDISSNNNIKNNEVKITVSSSPEDLSESSAVVSHAFKCQPSKFQNPVHVSLTSYLTPKPGEELRVDIMSKKGDADWEKIQEVPVRNGKAIKYDVFHFCWHVAVVSEDEEKKGLYHLLNDVWMHKETGRLLSLFWKDEVFLKKGSKALEADHKRIISVPGEIIVGIGSTVKVEVECRSSAELKMLSVHGSNSTLEITHEAMRKNFLSLLFEPNLRPDAIQTAERFRVVYRTKVFDAEDQPADGGFCTLLHYRWPMLCIQEPLSTGARQLKFTKVTDAKHGGLHLNTDALAQVLCQPGIGDKPVAVVGITGCMRSGKSFLLNFLLRYLWNKGWDNPNWIGNGDTCVDDGIEWAGGIKPCTEGIWICDGAFTVKRDNGEELAVLLVDTQGYSDSSVFDTNAIVFSLAGLLCSCLILNMTMNFTKHDLQYLRIFTANAKPIKTSEAPLQQLMFLIRDWSSKDEYEYGLKGGKSYWAMVSHRISADLDWYDPYSTFQSVQCFTMPHIGLRASYRRKREIHNADIDSDFLTLVHEFAQSVLNPSNITVRKHNGRPMTGRQLWFFMKVYNDAIWIKGAGSMEGIARDFEQVETRFACDDGIKMFKEKFKKVQDTVNPSELDEIYHIAIDDALWHFWQNTVDAGSQHSEQKSTSDGKSFGQDYYRTRLISECREHFKGISAWIKFRKIRATNQSKQITSEVSTKYTSRMKEDMKEEYHSVEELECFHHKHSAAAKLEYQTKTANESAFYDDHLKLLSEDIERTFANLVVVNKEKHILQTLEEQDNTKPDYQRYLLRHQIAQQCREDIEKFKGMHIEEEKLKELLSALQQSYTKMFEESWRNIGADMPYYRDNLRKVLEKECKDCITLNKRNKEIFQNCLDECVAKAEVIYHEHMYQLVEDDYCQPSDLEKAHERTVEQLECDIKAQLGEKGISKQVKIIDIAKRILQDRFEELKQLNHNNQEEKPPITWEVVEQKLTEAEKKMSWVRSSKLDQ